MKNSAEKLAQWRKAASIIGFTSLGVLMVDVLSINAMGTFGDPWGAFLITLNNLLVLGGLVTSFAIKVQIHRLLPTAPNADELRQIRRRTSHAVFWSLLIMPILYSMFCYQVWNLVKPSFGL